MGEETRSAHPELVEGSCRNQPQQGIARRQQFGLPPARAIDACVRQRALQPLRRFCGHCWQAFRDPDVLQAVENLKPLGVAVAVTQWGGPGDTRIVLPFEFLGSARDAKAFGFRASLIRRWMRASSTSIATGILDSAALMATNDYEGYRKIIDISGDGRDNSNVDLAAARDAVRKAGIVINGLPILAGDEELATYYETSVIVGADAFVEPARDFDDFARAITEKLLKELRPLGS